MRALGLGCLVVLTGLLLWWLATAGSEPPPPGLSSPAAGPSPAAVGVAADPGLARTAAGDVAAAAAAPAENAAAGADLVDLRVVVTGEAGERIAGCAVRAVTASPEPLTATTDAEGRATLALPRGRHHLDIVPPRPFAPTDGPVEVADGIGELTIVLVRRRDLPFCARLLIGEPPVALAGVMVRLHRQSGPDEVEYCNGNGDVRVQAEPRGCTLAVPEGPDNGPCFVVPVAGHETRETALPVRVPQRASLRVHVVDAADRPLAGETVRVAPRTSDATFPAGAWTPLELPQWEGMTDAAGAATAPLLPAGARTTVSVEKRRGRDPARAELRLRPGENTVVLRIEEGRIVCRVVDDAGAPLAGVEVGIEYWRRAEPPAVMRSSPGGPNNVRCDAEGRCSFGGLGPGTWLVGVVPDPAAPHTLEPVCQIVDVQGGVDAAVELRTRRGGFVEGMAVLADGTPVEGIGVELHTVGAAARFVLGTRSGADGRVRLGPLPRGEWQARTEVFDNRHGLLEPMRVRTGDSNVRFEMQPILVDVRLRVLDAGGRPRRAWVQMRHRAIGDALGFHTGLDGRAVHTGLRAGTWDVTADDHVGGVATAGDVELRPGEEPTPIELRLQPSGTLVVRCAPDEDQEIRCRQGEHVVYADGAQPHEVRRIRLPGGAYEVELFVRGTLLRRAGADVTPGNEREVQW